jgi:hypothetical protein
MASVGLVQNFMRLWPLTGHRGANFVPNKSWPTLPNRSAMLQDGHCAGSARRRSFLYITECNSIIDTKITACTIAPSSFFL